MIDLNLERAKEMVDAVPVGGSIESYDSEGYYAIHRDGCGFWILSGSGQYKNYLDSGSVPHLVAGRLDFEATK